MYPLHFKTLPQGVVLPWKTWNYLEFEYGDAFKSMKVFDEVSDMFNCTIKKALYRDITSVIKIHQSSLCQYLQESYIKILYPSDTIHPVIMFTALFKLPRLRILHVDIQLRFSFSIDDIDDELPGVFLEMEDVISGNYFVKELLINLNFPQCNTLINSLLTGVKRNETILSFSLSLKKYRSDISFNSVEELLITNRTLKAVKLNLIFDRILPSMSLCINESLTALDLGNSTICDFMTHPVKKSDILSYGVEKSITNLKSLVLYKPQIPLTTCFDSNPFLQYLSIELDQEESFTELFNIICSNTTITALKIASKSSLHRYWQIPVFRDEVGKSLQLMLSSNKTLQCLKIKIQWMVLPVKYLTAGLRENNTLQELALDYRPSDGNNLKEFFEAIHSLKSLAVTFPPFFRHNEIIPQVINMLQKNQEMKILKVLFRRRANRALQNIIMPEEDRKEFIPVAIPMPQQSFWETVVLHPSLSYICISGEEHNVKIQPTKREKAQLIAREEKKHGPPLIVEVKTKYGFFY